MSLKQLIQRLGRALGPAPTAERVQERQFAGVSTAIHELRMAVKDIEALIRVVEERSRTEEYLERRAVLDLEYQIEFLQRAYVEQEEVLLGLRAASSLKINHTLQLHTSHPLAIGSQDHIAPESTTEGTRRPTFFTRHIVEKLGQNITTLDVGVGGAGLVYEWARNGVLAVGIDGSDFCRANRVGYWPLLNQNLFTCDITKPFQFANRESGASHRFDVVTMWEVLEHIAEHDVPSVLNQIEKHMLPTSYFIGSISLLEYKSKTGEPYHVTLQPRAWWKKQFAKAGLEMLDQHQFNERLFCRGNGPRFEDFHNYFSHSEDGFLFVARVAESRPDKVELA